MSGEATVVYDAPSGSYVLVEMMTRRELKRPMRPDDTVIWRFRHLVGSQNACNVDGNLFGLKGGPSGPRWARVILAEDGREIARPNKEH